MIYRGYFQSLQGVDYQIDIQPVGTSTSVQEVTMAGTSPFVVSYNNSDSPFAPVRTSTATISIASSNYLKDAFTSSATGTTVSCYQSGGLVWFGYLKPSLDNQEYRNEIDTIELNASDALCALQYMEYKPVGTNKAIVSFLDIIKNICTSCGINGIYATKSKYDKSGNIISLSDLSISEQNFYTEDTNEPWKMNEVLEELCKYLGYTAIQKGKKLYLVDYQYLSKNTTIPFYSWQESTGWSIASVTRGGIMSISSDSYRGNGGDVTIDGIYNKCRVECSQYAPSSILPDPVSDANLVNRQGDFYKSYEVGQVLPASPQYPDGGFFSQKYTSDASDADYQFFHRLYDANGWESIYYNDSGTQKTLPDNYYKSIISVRDYEGGTIVDLASARKPYRDDYYNYQVTNKINYNRYICLNQRGLDNDLPLFKLCPGYKIMCVPPPNSYLVINFAMVPERYINRPYINPDWSTEQMKAGGNPAQDIMGKPSPRFILRIGSYYWNGSSWTTTATSFAITMEGDSDNMCAWNKKVKVLNNIDWTLGINEEGYKIPLNNIDLTQEIDFQILNPKMQHRVNGSYYWNQYTWLKDFSIKIVTTGQDADTEDSDVVIENVIDADSINELDDITVKINTYPGSGKISYSHTIYGGSLLEGIAEPSISNVFQSPEKNIIEKYCHQYQTPTIKENVSVGIGFDFCNKIYDAYWDNYFCVIGQEIDYATDSQQLALCQIKASGTLSLTPYAGTTTISSASTSQYIIIKSSSPWTASVDSASSSFASLSRTTGSTTTTSGTYIYLSVSKNPSNAYRRIIVTCINTEGYKVDLEFIQNPNPNAVVEDSNKSKAPYLVDSECIGCSGCYGIFQNCPVGVTVAFDANNHPTFSGLNYCIGCGSCLDIAQNVCPTNAIKGASI